MVCTVGTSFATNCGAFSSRANDSEVKKEKKEEDFRRQWREIWKQDLPEGTEEFRNRLVGAVREKCEALCRDLASGTFDADLFRCAAATFDLILSDDPNKKNIKETCRAFFTALQEEGAASESSLGDPFLTGQWPSAEIQSVFRWLCLESRRDETMHLRFVLLPSNDAKSQLTAWATHFFLRLALERNLFSGKALSPDPDGVEIRPVEIRVQDRNSFLHSLEGLFGAFDGELKKAEAQGEEMVINNCGGYKSISAFALLYAQVHELTSLYTFESGNHEALELTSLPVGYALASMDEEISLLKVLTRGGDLRQVFSDETMAKLPGWIRSLLFEEKEESEGSKKRLRVSSFAETLVQSYTRNRRAVSGIGKGLLDILRRSEPGGGLVRYVTERIENEWAELWLGDQIPETVEHSRRHSKRLMEIAANIFRCAEEPLTELGVLDPEALTLLVSCIYLHDIGHTAVAYPVASSAASAAFAGGVPHGAEPFPLSFFPSAVREVHHLLSRDMIESCDGASCGASPLFPAKGIAMETQTMLKTLVPLVCSYHRGYTRLVGDGCATPKASVLAVGNFLYKDAFRETLRPLKARLQDFRLSDAFGSLSVSQILAVAALLRVIDGCDVQADRVVDRIYLRARLARTRDEARVLKHEFDLLLHSPRLALPEALSAAFAVMRKAVETVSEFGERLDIDKVELGQLLDEERMEQIEETANGKGAVKGLYTMVFELLQSLRTYAEEKGASSSARSSFSDPSRAFFPGPLFSVFPVEMLLLSLANRVVFKWEQFLHFYKHQCVLCVLPRRDLHEKGKIVVDVWPNEEFGLEKAALDRELKEIADAITKEYQDLTKGLSGDSVPAEHPLGSVRFEGCPR
jgi:hypothetical protein